MSNLFNLNASQMWLLEILFFVCNYMELRICVCDAILRKVSSLYDDTQINNYTRGKEEVIQEEAKTHQWTLSQKLNVIFLQLWKLTRKENLI